MRPWQQAGLRRTIDDSRNNPCWCRLIGVFAVLPLFKASTNSPSSACISVSRLWFRSERLHGRGWWWMEKEEDNANMIWLHPRNDEHVLGNFLLARFWRCCWRVVLQPKWDFLVFSVGSKKDYTSNNLQIDLFTLSLTNSWECRMIHRCSRQFVALLLA